MISIVSANREEGLLGHLLSEGVIIVKGGAPVSLLDHQQLLAIFSFSNLSLLNDNICTNKIILEGDQIDGGLHGEI